MTATATVTPPLLRRVTRSGLGDELLAGRAANGDNSAFTMLYERYYGPLLGYTRSILLDAEDARDATQNALESALRALPGRDTSRPLRPWLYKIAHNEAIDIIRRRRPQAELTDALEPSVPGPEADAEQRGRLAQLVDDLRGLSDRQRGALVMRELNGLSYDEIGGALGLSVEAARRAVFDARNALHDAADGRATECVSVRHSISDGDRRSLRARSIRAHLRSCDDCSSFQRAIGSRRADLHVLAPWVSGAAIVGALGAGSVGGGGALLASSGAAAGGGGLSWAGLPLAVKGFAVAAAVAGTGTAAVEIKDVAKPDRPAPQARVAPPRDARADALALRAAALAAGAASRAAAPLAAAPARSSRIRATTGTARSSAGSTAIVASNPDAAELLPPTTSEAPSRPAGAAPHAAVKNSPPSYAAPLVLTPEERAVTKLGRLRDQVLKVLADAQALAGGGTQNALSMASGLLGRSLGPLLTSIERVLAPFGLKLPSSATVAAPSRPTFSNIFTPVRGILDGVQSLLARLLGRG